MLRIPAPVSAARPVALSFLLSALLGAQIVPLDPGKSQKDNTIEYTSRSSIPGPMTGRLSTEMLFNQWAGVRGLDSIVFNSQDQDASTQESFVFEVRRRGPGSSLPDWPAALPPLYAVNLTPPSGTGLTAWQWTVTPATPLPVPGSEPFFLVWQVPANAAWTADGVSIQMGSGSPHACGTTGAPACCGPASLPYLGGWERPRGHAPNGAQPNILDLSPADTQSGNLAYATMDRQYFHWIKTDVPALQVLASDPAAFCSVNEPNTGHAAILPDVNDELAQGRNDNFGWRIRGGSAFANGLAIIFSSDGIEESPLPLPFGDLWVDVFSPFFTMLIMPHTALDASGTGNLILPLGSPGSSARAALAGFGFMHSQAVVFDATFQNMRLTNLATFMFAADNGVEQDIDAAGEFTVPWTAAHRWVKVWNKGPDDVTVITYDAQGAEMTRQLIPKGTSKKVMRGGATTCKIVSKGDKGATVEYEMGR